MDPAIKWSSITRRGLSARPPSVLRVLRNAIRHHQPDGNAAYLDTANHCGRSATSSSATATLRLWVILRKCGVEQARSGSCPEHEKGSSATATAGCLIPALPRNNVDVNVAPVAVSGRQLVSQPKLSVPAGPSSAQPCLPPTSHPNEKGDVTDSSRRSVKCQLDLVSNSSFGYPQFETPVVNKLRGRVGL